MRIPTVPSPTKKQEDEDASTQVLSEDVSEKDAVVLAAQTENRNSQLETQEKQEGKKEIPFSVYFYFILGVILFIASGILLILKYKSELMRGIIHE